MWWRLLWFQAHNHGGHTFDAVIWCSGEQRPAARFLDSCPFKCDVCNKLLTCHVLFHMHLFRIHHYVNPPQLWGSISICRAPGGEYRCRGGRAFGEAPHVPPVEQHNNSASARAAPTLSSSTGLIPTDQRASRLINIQNRLKIAPASGV